VGGLLQVTYHGNALTNAFVAFDGNGNVTALVNAGDGTVVGNYEYGPFGEVIRNSGPLARNVPFRFSTKYQDDESDLLYYGKRYYKPSTGTWLSRDPLNMVIGTQARFDLLDDAGLDDENALRLAKNGPDSSDYAFANNEPISNFDVLGFCVPLPDSGPGSFDGSPWKVFKHKWNKKKNMGATLTFTVCCPMFFPYLSEFGQMSPDAPPPPTLNANTFPYAVVSAPTGNGPCYTIVLEVPSTTATEYDLQYGPYANFVPSIRIVGGCCCTKSGLPVEENPPTSPPHLRATGTDRAINEISLFRQRREARNI
jgi:RHS repeat-associated protein